MEVEQKLVDGIPLSFADGLALYEQPLHYLGRLAHQQKIHRFGEGISYLRNYYMNFTNICHYACKYCGFRRNKRQADAYTLTIDAIAAKLQKAPEDISEVWFSSGLNRELPFSYYTDLLKAVKQVLPKVHIKAFTAVEIDFFAQTFGQSHEKILDDLFAAGLDRIPGGGAEIFDESVREKIDIKTKTSDYLRIHRLCHERGVPTNITMLFGHIEERGQRIKHMLTLRDFQEQSGGVQAFIPLAFQDQNNPLAKQGVKGPSAVEILKTLAISRILLHNIDHVQSFWVDTGEELTQISLHYGVDDINGTLIEENIAHQSGSPTKTYQPVDNLQGWIRGAGFVPWERDIYFKPRQSSLP